MAITEGWLGIALKKSIKLITRCRSLALIVVGLLARRAFSSALAEG
jgi:hypothetical protein